MSKIIDTYFNLKESNKSIMYLFKCGKFYIFIDEDCDKINEYVVLKKVKFSNDIYKCGFPENVLEDYLRVFKNHGLHVEIIEEVNNNKKCELENYVKKINIDNLTPLEALNELNKIKEMVCNGKRN